MYNESQWNFVSLSLTLTYRGRGGADPEGCPGCPDTRPLLRVPFLKIYCGPILRNLRCPVSLDYRNSIARKIDATYVIKAHSIIQYVMSWNHWNAGKMNQTVSRFSNFLGYRSPRLPAGARLRHACWGFRPLRCPLLMDWTPAQAALAKS